jgi:toxin ParE1/3/4
MPGLAIHEAAETEMAEAASFYEAGTAGLGHAFLDDIEKSFERILADPEAFPIVGENVRQALSRRFPYSIFFAIESADFIRVVAVAHQKRRPEYWRNRL